MKVYLSNKRTRRLDEMNVVMVRKKDTKRRLREIVVVVCAFTDAYTDAIRRLDDVYF